ncbi:expressed unknown protein [Seminavis robusta]|uniref:Uncharacterized protein n=1 Tax=Seminavis robusta TaxID=568900 RepID=A0A9N8DSS2_9STRA|nr:expressed unknown protein [Seminavis robusta]|eukprot:Sro325_g117730.1 n/a (113) ;mRNA; r:15146-15600
MPSTNGRLHFSLWNRIIHGRHSHDDDEETVCLDRNNGVDMIHVRRIPMEVVDESDDTANSTVPPPFMEPHPTRFWIYNKAHGHHHNIIGENAGMSPRGPRRWTAASANKQRD